MAFVQSLSFIVRRAALEKLLANSANEVLWITLGVNQAAGLQIVAFGGKESFPSAIESENVPICPVPPDCEGEGI